MPSSLFGPRNLVSNMAQLDHPAMDFMSTEEVTICVLPLFHIFSMNLTMSNILLRGGKLVTLPKFEPATFLAALLRYRPTFLHLAPPLVQFLANHPAVTEDHLASLHTVILSRNQLELQRFLRFSAQSRLKGAERENINVS